MKIVWTEDWAWGLGLTAFTIMAHSAALIGITEPLGRLGVSLRRLRGRRSASVAIAILFMGMVGLLVAILHGAWSVVWAIAYVKLGALPRFSDAIFYSVDSLSARGASGLELARSWRLLGALEAANGLLLFGISTAFLAVMIAEVRNRLFPGPSLAPHT